VFFRIRHVLRIYDSEVSKFALNIACKIAVKHSEKDFVKKALTHRIHKRGPREWDQFEVIGSNEKLVLGVKFAIFMVVCLSAFEFAHMAFLGAWNIELFVAVTGLSGTIMGIFAVQKT